MTTNKRRTALYSSASKICKTSLGLYVFATILSAPAMAAVVPTYADQTAMEAAGITGATAFQITNSTGAFETVIESGDITSTIWNEASGGGTKVVNTGTDMKAFTGVHSDGSRTFVSSYATTTDPDDPTKRYGTRLYMTTEGAYLATGNSADAVFNSSNLITTKGEVNSAIEDLALGSLDDVVVANFDEEAADATIVGAINQLDINVGSNTAAIDTKLNSATFNAFTGTVYTKDETYSTATINEKLDAKLNSATFNDFTGTVYTKDETYSTATIDDKLLAKLDSSTFYDYTGTVNTALEGKLNTSTFNDFSNTVSNAFYTTNSNVASNTQAIATNMENIEENANAIKYLVENVIGGTYDSATGDIDPADFNPDLLPSGTSATVVNAINQLHNDMTNGDFDATFNTITTTDSATIGGNLTAASAQINGAMSVTGSATVNNLKSNAGIFVASGAPETTTFAVDANGNTSVSGTLNVSNVATFSSNVTVQGDLIAQHGFVVDENNALLSTGLKTVAANISGDVNVGGNVNVSGTVNSQGLNAGSGTIETTSGDIKTTTGDIYSTSGDIFTTSGAIFTTSGNISTVSGNISTTSGNVSAVNMIASGYVQAEGNVTGDNLIAKTGIKLDNNKFAVTNDGSISVQNGKFAVDGNTGNTTVGGTLTVSNVATFSSNVTVNGDTEMNGSLTVSNVATFNSNVTVKGELTAEQGVFVNDSNSLTADGLTASSVHSFGEMVAGGQIMVVQNPGTADEVAMFKADTNGNVTASGTMEVAGMSKFFKDASGTFSLEVAEDAVTANKVIEAKQGVVFGSDTVAMTTVAQDAVSAQAADANSNTLVSAQALQATRAAMNNENQGVFGALYAVASDTGAVSYNSNALTTFGFEEGSENVTDALLKYAENAAAAAGTTYAADGSFTNGYASATSVSYAALTGSETLAQAIGQVALNIGSATTGTNSNVLADNTVNQNLDLLDANVGNLATITTGTIVTTNSNVTAALQDLATNTSNALGGAFTNGAWSGLVDNSAGSNGYAYSSATTVMAAINQVAANVGTADELDQNYNGVSTSNTVNANLNSLNKTIGDITTLNTELGNLTNGTETAPSNVVTALNNLDATLGKIHNLNPDGRVVPAGRVASTTGDNSNLAMGTTVEEHLVSLDNAIGNREIESLNDDINDATKGTGSLAAGLEAAGNVIGDGDFTPTNYVSAVDNLSDAVRGLDTNLYRVERKLNDLRHDFKSGMASMAAMTALVPNSRSAGNTSLSLGTGAYDGHTAMAVGGFHYLTDNILLNAGFAWGNSNDTTYRMGVTWSW